MSQLKRLAASTPLALGVTAGLFTVMIVLIRTEFAPVDAPEIDLVELAPAIEDIEIRQRDLTPAPRPTDSPLSRTQMTDPPRQSTTIFKPRNMRCAARHLPDQVKPDLPRVHIRNHQPRISIDDNRSSLIQRPARHHLNAINRNVYTASHRPRYRPRHPAIILDQPEYTYRIIAYAQNLIIRRNRTARHRARMVQRIAKPKPV